MEIVQVDPFDAKQFDAWHATYAAAEQFGRGDHANDWLLEEARATKQADEPATKTWAFSAMVDGEVVACSELEVYELDNRDLAWGKVYTHPDRRRRGHGTQLVTHLEAQVLARGRSRLLTEVAFPFESPEDGAGHLDIDFARHRGFDLALGDIQRVLKLPVPQQLLVELEEEAAPFHRQYAFRTFSGRVPDDLVEGYAELVASLATEAPTGDLDLEVARGDVAAFRAEEETVIAQSRTRWATVAIAEDGTLAGYTDLVTSSVEPDRAFQWGTLVKRAHRGTRLGLALKVRNVRHLQENGPAVDRIHTWNADVNAHMVGVNDRLGFRPVERLGEFTKTLATPTS